MDKFEINLKPHLKQLSVDMKQNSVKKLSLYMLDFQNALVNGRFINIEYTSNREVYIRINNKQKQEHHKNLSKNFLYL